MNQFNFMGFLVAHQRGKKLSKSNRNKNAMLSALFPAGNMASVVAPMALADKEVAKLERNEATQKLTDTQAERNAVAQKLNETSVELLSTKDERDAAVISLNEASEALTRANEAFTEKVAELEDIQGQIQELNANISGLDDMIARLQSEIPDDDSNNEIIGEAFLTYYRKIDPNLKFDNMVRLPLFSRFTQSRKDTIIKLFTKLPTPHLITLAESKVEKAPVPEIKEEAESTVKKTSKPSTKKADSKESKD
ncbi:MAG: hypothetical protein AAF206_06700 [Bacteroidota bacterium]